MTLDEYNQAVKAILDEQQQIAQETGRLCMSGQAHVMNSEFVQLLTRQGTLIQQLARLNTDAMTAVIERIKAAGIPADAIQTTGYNLQPEFDYAAGKQTLRGYVARNQVQVRVDALAKTGDVITAVVASGATTISGVRFDLKDRDAAEREALRLAVQDARRRADYAARGADVTIDRVVRIDEQRDMGDVVRPMRLDMAMMKSEMVQTAVPLEAGEIEVRSRVTLTVAIK